MAELLKTYGEIASEIVSAGPVPIRFVVSEIVARIPQSKESTVRGVLYATAKRGYWIEIKNGIVKQRHVPLIPSVFSVS